MLAPLKENFLRKKDIPGKVLKIVKNGYLQKFKIINFKIFEKKYKNFLKEKKILILFSFGRCLMQSISSKIMKIIRVNLNPTF